MIRALIHTNGNHPYLEMTGHAEYNPGNDVVCAGASSIVYTLAGYLSCAGHEPELMQLEPGSARISIDISKSEHRVAIKTAFDMAAIGLLQLEKTYPSHVQVMAD